MILHLENSESFFNLLVLRNKFSKVARCRINVQKNLICMPLQQTTQMLKLRKHYFYCATKIKHLEINLTEGTELVH